MSFWIQLKSMKKWRKKLMLSLLNMFKYVYMCLKTGYWICLKFLNAEILNITKFWRKQVFQNASIAQATEYARICIDKGLNISWVLNMPGFWIWKGSEYARIMQDSKYAAIWLNMSENDMNRPEYVWILNNRLSSEYVSCNTQCEVTVKVNEYLLRDYVFRTWSKI